MKKKQPVFLTVIIFMLSCSEGILNSGVADNQRQTEDAGLYDASTDTTVSQNLKYIDPSIGTGGYSPWGVGSNLPGATAPFGMVKVSPDTQSEKDYTFQNHCAGYFYNDEYI
ncbi:MAG: hypothetical protein N3B13_10925, partial [Deltaproteobacteria bacterium]|nr:hypothetical protein [Deltaproteobacteria bacterium]